MPKIEPIILLSLVCSIAGLVLIYISSSHIEPTKLRVSDMNSELIGRFVVTSGKITNKKSSDAGHVFLTVSDNKSSIQVPLFASFMKKLMENGISENDLKVGYKVSISGLLDEYQGQLQIIPRKITDFKILSD
jgi:DNA/RNA endonuclease YhcR with UshA esterase domain